MQKLIEKQGFYEYARFGVMHNGKQIIGKLKLRGNGDDLFWYVRNGEEPIVRELPDKFITSKLKPDHLVHEHEQSVEVARYYIEKFTWPGETVIDFCLGSGTTGDAALSCGRRFIGVDEKLDYCKAAGL